MFNLTGGFEIFYNTVCGAFLPLLLFLCGVLFFFRVGKYVFSPRFIYHTFKNDKSSLRSLWLALGGTLGVGNICGVASAIYIGGAGCVFWIWVCALLCAVTKYAETLLAVKYREFKNGEYNGGTPFYIQNVLGSRKLAKLFCFFCIFTAFTMGNVTQVYSAADFVYQALDIPRVAVGVIFLICVFVLTLGKGNWIISFTSKTVPALCICYTICSVICIFTFREAIPRVISKILSEAFTLRAGIGGLLCSPAIRLGITRGVMSNEAGCGTAPIAYAADPDTIPVKSGLLGICEVLVDTLMLCTLTAFAVLLPNIELSESSAKTVLDAFSLALGDYITPFLSVSVFLFALASVSAWAFYVEKTAVFLSYGKKFGIFFTLAYPLTSFLGCFISEGAVWALSDISVCAMAIINVISIILLQNKIKSETKYHYQLICKKAL